ncbi:hypothetical protein HZH66_013382 [Vespula vulgaris]|uniref:Uncharacterized protein n=1 Tax=Vespula vulgaris TaxID=7454 RepID=A0A834MRY5_VESVU|nr:hypothetical protein HZH66_013382 [Vespula vulgaris]
MYWHRGAITDKTMPHNKSKITLIHKRKKIIQLIKIAIANTFQVYLQQKQYLQHHRQEEPDTPRRRSNSINPPRLATERMVTSQPPEALLDFIPVFDDVGCDKLYHKRILFNGKTFQDRAFVYIKLTHIPKHLNSR